jgi:hypothetical protein
MSASCQKRTHALEQTAAFHHLVKDDTGMVTTVNVVEISPRRGTPSRVRDGVNSAKTLALNRCRRCNCDQRWVSEMRPVNWSQNAHWCATAKFVSVVGAGGTSDCIT